MKKLNEKTVVAKVLVKVAESMLKSSANTRCAFVYHQPKQPSELRNFRKF